MFLIRSIAKAQGGKRDAAVALMKEMSAAAHTEFGFPTARVLTASVGPSDSTVVMEYEVETLAAFGETLDKMNAWPGMARFGEKLPQLFLAGTHCFEVYRIQ